MIGFSVRQIQHRVAPDIVAKYRGVPTATISDCMSRMTAAGARIRPMHDGGHLVGPAFTVKTRPGDNLLIHKALDMALPGDVIVVDAGGDLTNSLVGEIMSSYARMRGIAGLVVNGAIRDSDSIRKSSFPVFAAGVSHRGALRSGPGAIGRPLALDGLVLDPGDLIVGDGAGVVSVPRELADG
ncbi:RraA family protein, partial [Rhodopseudomonas sp.]|uniref:RraA family protein n=1 Tax=Rhodopseudomonas sp. TaxID=1078 RepID=UPI003B3AFA6E